jgi:hypothetical protein
MYISNGDQNKSFLFPDIHEVDFLRITGRRMRKSRKNRNNLKKDENRLNKGFKIYLFHV